MPKKISILDSQLFSSEDIKSLQAFLVKHLDSDEHCVVLVAGDEENHVLHLIKKLSIWYPSSLFCFCLSEDAFLQSDRFEIVGKGICSLDIALTIYEKETAKTMRDKAIIQNANIIIKHKASRLYDDDVFSVFQKIITI